ncbi:MAG: M13-type metalloendopeptidase, partial [Bifidobacteriaceae bacterium]|nr:M13-type metalloendopeptidase [Bifidobacteriaceae bacterium]
MSTNKISGLDPTSFSSVIKAGNDLFRFVNGPWIDTYTLPEDRSRYGSFDKLAENAEKQIHEILEDEHTAAQKSRALYRAFMNKQDIESAGIQPISEDLKAIDTANNKQELIKVLARLDHHDGPNFFGLAVYPDPGNPEYNIVHLEQGGLGLPDEAYYREDHYKPIREAYKHMVAKQLENAQYATVANSAELAQRFLDFETSIARHHWDNVQTRDSQKTYNPTSLEDLNSTLSHVHLLDWIRAWQESYDSYDQGKQPVNLHDALSTSIVHEPSFFSGFNDLWENTSLEDLQLWARVHHIISHAYMLSEQFDVTNFEFFGKVLSGSQQQRDRWKRAVSLVNSICGEEVGKEYVKLHFPASSKERMQELVHNLIHAYHESITHSDWLGEQTKQKALEKLAKFSPKIGYTNHWRDYTALNIQDNASLVENMNAACLYASGYYLSKVGKVVDKDEWLMNPQTVNAYYEPTMNVIVFPAAILQPPFFNPEAEDAANYGGIGAVIGHEIGHGFDDQGSQFDGNGKLHDWW